MGTWTPWGTVQRSEETAPGITWYSTASHGGYGLSPERQAAMPDHLRLENRGLRGAGPKGPGWYEEDCDWCLVTLAFPELFSSEDRALALNTCRGWHPDAYEAHTGKVIAPGESYVKDKARHDAEHVDDFMVRCAWGADGHENIPEGMVGVLAGRGSRGSGGSERLFLVPVAEYRARDSRLPFVIDLDRHEGIESIGADSRTKAVGGR